MTLSSGKKLLAIFVTSENYRMTNHWPQTKTCTGEKKRIGFTAFHCPLSLRKTVKSRRHVYYYFVWFCSSSQSICRYAFRPPTVNLFLNERLIAQYENVSSFCYNVPVLTVSLASKQTCSHCEWVQFYFLIVTGVKLPRLSISRTPL